MHIDRDDKLEAKFVALAESEPSELSEVADVLPAATKAA